MEKRIDFLQNICILSFQETGTSSTCGKLRKIKEINAERMERR